MPLARMTLALLVLQLLASRAPTAAADQETPKPSVAAVCRDSQGGEYSPGAVVTLDGKQLECVIGPHWVPAGTEPPVAGTDVLDVGDANMAAELEATIHAVLKGPVLPALQCDTVLNSDARPDQLLRVPPGEQRLILFWTPTCGPCKPVLSDMAALAAERPRNLSFLSVVQAADSELEPPGEWQLLRVKQLVTQYKAGMPTCVHSSREVTRRWRAQGVPLVLLISQAGVERVALGGRNGQRLVAEVARAK